MSEIHEIFDENVIRQYKENQHEITEELLTTLRETNEGKHIALEILELPKDEEQYFLDAYGNRISYMGNRRLKKPYTRISLSEIHKTEITKCKNDIHYFKDNYVKIKTPKGIEFPFLREYQNEFIDSLLPDEHEDNIGLMGRQSGKTISTSIYAAYKYIFSTDIAIGIVANKGRMAREFLSNIKNILIELPMWLQPGTTVWNKGSIENESKMIIMTDVPSSDAFRGFTIGLLIVDECAFIRPSVWGEFSDSIFPSQSGLAWKKNIILSTAKGMNHFYDMVDGARKKTNGMNIYEVDWRDVPRYKPDGTVMSNEEFYNKIVNKYGIIYFNQNYANEFVGSSHTLISAERLKEMRSMIPEEIRDGKLKIYHYPIKDHRYIMSVDAAKDGEDYFAVQVIDITDFDFKQAATARMKIDYLKMPEFLNEWCEFYNKPYLIIENNEGAGQSIADQMYNDYEYENLHFDKDVGRNKKKKFPGFRTTSKSRRQILQTLKLFIENGKLTVNDKSTINEFFQFIMIKKKFQAEDGAHDDMIMSLALIFAPFTNTKNFEDMKLVIKNLYEDEDLTEEEKIDFGDMLTMCEFNDGTDEEYLASTEQKEYLTMEEAMMDIEGF